MLLDEVLTFLQVAGVGTIGTSLFASSKAQIPDVDTPVTLVQEYGGLGAERAMGAMNVVAEQPRIQVLVRARDYGDARTTAQAAYTAFLPVANQDLSGTRYLDIEPIQPPFDLGVDGNNRAQVAFNAHVRKALS